MRIEFACKKRHIGKIGIETPLLVPSFSSVFTERIREIYEWIRAQISSASLVSSYDLFYDFIPPERIWTSDVVFIDSGTFEYESTSSRKDQKSWSPILHTECIGRLKPLTRLVLVSYDRKCSPINQIRSALKFYSDYPNQAICFLYRPSSDNQKSVDVERYISNIASLKPFDILGFTEKELGDSLFERCKTISTIRESLASNGLDTPIHVFGCLDPLCIIPYFICGADVFDGLSWLRYGFHNNVAIYPNNYSLLRRYWSESDSRVLERIFVLNLKELEDLMRRMKQFSEEYNPSVFGLPNEIVYEVKDLTHSAGIEY